MRWLDSIWYQPHALSVVLAPLGWLYAAAALTRRSLYRMGVLPTQRVQVPVIVVGNIAVGGTGKTPLVIWLAEFLRAQGMRPGIICRGYGGAARSWPQQVRADSDPKIVGDEPVLLASRTGCPVAAGPHRVRAAAALITHADCDIIVSDDGLQHLRLARTVEIAVIDGVRRHGNGRCLPAGPLREPVSRLGRVDMVVTNGGALRGEFEMHLKPSTAFNVSAPRHTRALADFRNAPVHAVCGIGHPQRFFTMLQGMGIKVTTHAFPDHHAFRAQDIHFGDGLPVLMTEKDAVKCARFAGEHHWAVTVTAELHPAFAVRLLALLGRRAEPGSDAIGLRR